MKHNIISKMLLEIFNLRLKFQDQVGNAKEGYQRLHIMLAEQIKRV